MKNGQMEQVLAEKVRTVNKLFRKQGVARRFEIKKTISCVDYGETRHWEVWVAEEWEKTPEGEIATVEECLFSTRYMAEIEGFLDAIRVIREKPYTAGLQKNTLPTCKCCHTEGPACEEMSAKNTAKKPVKQKAKKRK